MSPTPTRALRATFIFFLVLGFTGCRTLEGWFLPHRAELREIHEVYRTEFLSSFGTPSRDGDAEIGLPPTSPAAAAAPVGGSVSTCETPEGAADPFPKTRAKIREYRTKHPAGGGRDRERAHLIVLEGMIFLQAGRIGTARGLVEQVRAAAATLHSGTGRLVRDAIFAESFSEMVDGWEAVCVAIPEGDTEEVDRYAGPAGVIADALARHRAAGDLAEAEADQGALYLSATAAIFYEWADLSNETHCTLNEPECDQRKHDDAFYLEQGKAVLDAANVDDASPARYADVYRRIEAKIVAR